MADREILALNEGVDPKQIQAPQAGDRYVANRDVHLTQPLTTTSTINGRWPINDGIKLDRITVTQPINLDTINTANVALDKGVHFKGYWLTGANFPTATRIGEMYIIFEDSTYNGVSMKAGDCIIAIKLNPPPGFVFKTYWFHIDNSHKVSSVAGKTGAITLVESDISDLQNYILPSDIDTIAKLNNLVSNTIVVDADPRLTDARTPTAHNHVPPYTVATLPSPATVGNMARVTDGDTGLLWGEIAKNTGGGATPYLVWYNGTNWTVVGK